MIHQAADRGKHVAPMLFSLRVVMLGRQGSGKGTQGMQLARLLIVPHISVGDVLREAAGSGFPLGRRVQETAVAGIVSGGTLDRAVVIDVPLEVARARLVARRVCTGCGRIYSVERAQGLETWTCGACGGDVRRRADDTAEAVTRRLTLYDEQTKPLLDWFSRREELLVVDGVGTSEEVFSTVGFEGREAALGEIAASRARLLHLERAGAAVTAGVRD
jgi:adenylate kinase